jgi:iron complex transport system substrate-binding protein
MKKFLCRFTSLLLLGVLVYLLASACSQRNDVASRSTVQCPDDCRVIQHSMGETCIPKHPERVATIFHGILGSALSFGVKPIASSVLEIQNPFPAYLGNQVNGVKPIGSQNEPNLESILMLKPDLILVWQNIQAIYPLLSKISPTVIIPWRGPSAWREHIELVAKALGKEEAMQQAWKHYYQRIDELKIALGDQYKNKKISVLTPSSQWGFFIHAKNSFAGSILNDLELDRPKVQNVETSSGYVTSTSEEQLEMIDGDIIFALIYKEEDRKAFERMLQTPLGTKLKAVREERIYFVDTLPWGSANFIAADVVLDDLYKYLVNTPGGESGEKMGG